jgi:hypothetical protein
MRTRVPELRRRQPAPSERPRPWVRSSLAPALVVSAVAVIVLAFFLSIYPVKGYTVPIGWDQSEYLWRTTLAQRVGVANIDRPLPAVPSPKAGRPAFPVIAASLSSLTGSHPFRVAMVLTPVMAAVIGLAAGALVAGVLRRPVWDLAAVALGVGLSSLVVRLMMPEAYFDTMFAAAVFLAAAIPLALSMDSRRAVVPAMLLLAAGGVIHWSFFALVAAALLLAGAALLPRSWRGWRSGRDRLLDTPTARIGEALLGGTALAGVTTLGVLSGGVPAPRVDVSEFAKKLRRDLPKYRFPITLPLAALGVVPLAAGARTRSPDRDRHRFLLVFLLAWCAVVLGGYLARTVLHLPLPAHRFLSFALPVPILAVLGILALGRLAAARTAPALAAVGVVLALGTGALVGHVQWFGAKTFTEAAKIRDVTAALAYLEGVGVPPEHPVVFVIETTDWNAAALWGHMIRAALPADRIPHAHVFVGTPGDFLARRPADTAISQSYFRRVEPLYPADPVALVPNSFNRTAYEEWIFAHPDTEVADRVAVVQGPPPPRALASLAGVAAPVGPIAWWRLGLLAAAALVILGLCGLGWAIAGLGRWLRPAEVLAVAPAIGVGALVMGGVLADALGIRLAGLGGALTPAVIALAGAGLAVWLRARRNKAAPATRA